MELTCGISKFPLDALSCCQSPADAYTLSILGKVRCLLWTSLCPSVWFVTTLLMRPSVAIECLLSGNTVPEGASRAFSHLFLTTCL